MEYNKIIYKLFKLNGKKEWKFVRTFYNYREVYMYMNSHSGTYHLEKEESFD